jgi:endoglucanase
MKGKVLTFLAVLILFYIQKATADVEYFGVNLAGADFGEGNLPGVYGTHYTYPTIAEVDYFVGKGMNVFRLPFRWERLQNSAFETLNATELTRMDNFVNYATAQGASVVLDPHNYSRYYGEIIGSTNLDVSAFEDFWAKLAAHYKNNARVIFGLMNEPNSMSSELWRDNANAAIQAIRRAGAHNLILVPGNGWTGAHSWTQNWYGTPNATLMLTIVDSLNNYAFDVHQYLDSNSSGTSPTCVSATIGSTRLQSFTNWARTNGKRGFLGEFAASDNATCNTAIDNMLAYMLDNSDVWLGWTWWAAGPWWGNYMFSLEPNGNTDAPQMALIEPFIGVATDIKDPGDIVKPQNFQLKQNYPNPFNPSTVINYHLASGNRVRLTVFDINGREIKSLVNKYQPAGDYSITFESAGLTSGIYLYKIQADNFSQIKRMLLIK